MAENYTNITDPNQMNGASKQQAIPKKQRRKALPNAVQSSTARVEISIKAIVSNTPKAVSSDDFPLFRAFSLDSTGNGDLFIKVTKHRIISLSTGDAFSSSTTGYLLSL